MFIKIALIVLAILIILSLVIMIVVSRYLANNFLCRQEYDLDKEKYAQSCELYGVDLEWLKDKDVTDLCFRSFDDTKLSGIYIKNPSGINKVAILHHGFNCDHTGMISYAKMYYEMGYNILMNDSRCSGKSEGNHITFGERESKDLYKWIDQIVFMNGKDVKVVLHGVSMGAATCCLCSQYDISRNVKAIVSDCSYSSFYDQCVHKLSEKMPRFVSQILTFWGFVGTIVFYGVNLFKTNAVKAVSKSTCPMLFIHGSGDDFVPFAMVDSLYNACNSVKQKYVMEDAVHALSIMHNPTLYKEAVETFLNEVMK